MSWGNKIAKQEQDQRTYQNSADARRVMTVDEDGNYVSGGGSGTSVTPFIKTNYTMQYVDKTSTSNVVYLCKERNNGKWLFTKINKSTGNPEFTFANVSNNPTKTTYDLAFADRTSLTYEKLEEVTDL